MSTIDKIISKGTTYSIADSQARTDLQTLNTRVFNLEQHGGGGGTTPHVTGEILIYASGATVTGEMLII